MDIKEVLKTGAATEEDLINQLQNQINNAKAEIAKEKADADRKARETKANKTHRMRIAAAKDLVTTATRYMVLAGMVDSDFTLDEEDTNFLANLIDASVVADSKLNKDKDLASDIASLNKIFGQKDFENAMPNGARIKKNTYSASKSNDDKILEKFLAEFAR